MASRLRNHGMAVAERRSKTRLAETRKTAAYYFTRPVVRLLERTPVAPDVLSWSGLAVSVGAAVLILTGYLFVAGLVVLFAGLFDMLDGALARSTNRTTRFGAVLDSTLDRLAETVVLLGILALFLFTDAQPAPFAGLSREWAVVLAGVALPGSLLVSYIRARAEAEGVPCQEGLFTRAERVVVLALGLLLSQIDYALIVALAVIALFSYITVGHRLFSVWRRMKNLPAGGE